MCPQVSLEMCIVEDQSVGSNVGLPLHLLAVGLLEITQLSVPAQLHAMGTIIGPTS